MGHDHDQSLDRCSPRRLLQLRLQPTRDQLQALLPSTQHPFLRAIREGDLQDRVDFFVQVFPFLLQVIDLFLEGSKLIKASPSVCCIRSLSHLEEKNKAKG